MRGGAGLRVSEAGASGSEQPLTKRRPGVGSATWPLRGAHSVGLYFLIISITPACGGVGPRRGSWHLQVTRSSLSRQQIGGSAAAASPAPALTGVSDHGGHGAKLGERGALGGCCGGHACRNARIWSAATATGRERGFRCSPGRAGTRAAARQLRRTRVEAPEARRGLGMSRSISRRLRALHAPMRLVDTSGERSERKSLLFPAASA